MLKQISRKLNLYSIMQMKYLAERGFPCNLFVNAEAQKDAGKHGDFGFEILNFES